MITQIELANYLGEGFKVDGRRESEAWNPLYRAVTLPLRGQSAAIQIENGDGKSSISEGCIYLLSRDRRLKEKVFSRCAPSENGWSHVRIEFGIKDQSENILQQDLITESPEEFPGITYVVGLCTNRDTKEANFYIYNGTLSDAPVYKNNGTGLMLIDNDAFKKSVERISGSKWNKWSRKADWEEDIKQFVDTEVVRQNVEFQITGAGDASAMLHNIKPEAGESFDAAFFRHLIAPELLKNPMGNEEKDEHQFEDTLVKTLQGVSSAMVEIASKEAEYDNAADALTKFEPVIEKAELVVKADFEYKTELSTIIDDAAIVHTITIADPIPGIPKINKASSWINDKRVVEVISHMVIDKREGVLITDDGLSALTGIPTSEINRRAKNGHAIGSQLIDFKYHSKILLDISSETSSSDEISYLIHFKHHSKTDGKHGGRRNSMTGYKIDATPSILDSIANLSGAHTSNLESLLTRAFGIAMTEIDANPYRLERNKLTNELNKARSAHKAAKDSEGECQREIESLEMQVVEAEANQIAYSDFVRRKSEFPDHLYESPLSAHEWAKTASKEAQDALSMHQKKAGALTAGYQSWKKLISENGKVPLSNALSYLNGQHTKLTKDKSEAIKDLKGTREEESKLRTSHDTESKKLLALSSKQVKLEEMKSQLPAFFEIFGDVDPSSLNPQADLKQATDKKNSLTRQIVESESLSKRFVQLKPGVDLYVSTFGNADVNSLNPVADLDKLQQAINLEENVITDHQPLVDALTWFEDLNPNKTPSQWLIDTSTLRERLNSERAGNVSKIGNLNGELSDLETFAVADDRVYAHALQLLENANINFERLYDVIKAAAKGDRLNQLLTLFSAALSAPVVTSIKDAESTTALLEKERASVPVFLKDQLVKFARSGDVESSGDLAFNFLVGRRTRQVEILLNPNLIIEEKARISLEIDNLTTTNNSIKSQLLKIAEDSDDVRSVLMAKDAISKGSVSKHTEATNTLNDLQRELPALKRRASPDVLSAIEAMKQFAAIGGNDKLTQLTEVDLPALKTASDSISDEIIKLEQQTTDLANKARIAATDFNTFGGEADYTRVSQEISKLELRVKGLLDSINDTATKIENLDKLSKFSSDQLSEFERTYYVKVEQLQAAIDFESASNVSFMEAADESEQVAIAQIDAATARLSGIDFEKAQRYLESVKSGDKDITERIANAKAAKVAAISRVEDVSKNLQRLDADIANLSPFVEDLHELVVVTLDQYKKIALLGNDVRQKYLTTKITNHEVSRYADEVRISSLGDKPGTSNENKISIYNLKESIASLRIDTQQLLRLDNARRSASGDFDEKRNEFCSKARNNEIKGLSHLEIEDIAKAKTIDELNHIQELKGRIDLQIQQKQAELQKSKDLAVESKNASIDNMSKFARQAEMNLKLMDRVMQKTPSGRFYIDVQIADQERITRVVESLLNEIQDRERSFRERSSVMLNDDIAKRKEMYRELVKNSIYRNLFINPVVEFSHTGIWDGARKPMNNEMSKGQITALHLMWMIKQAEYSLQLVASRYSSKRERDTALKNSQRILFFDGLFSNLSNDNIIDDAFQGLKFVGENFQLIGLLHHPRYVNNAEIFPIHLVGKRFKNASDTKKRGFMAVQPWQQGGDMAMFASFFKRKVDDIHV